MTVLKKLNPQADVENMIVLAGSESGCCGSSGAVCGYLLAYTQANYPIPSVVVLDADGAEVTLTFETTAADAGAFVTELTAILEASPSATNPGAGAVVNGGISVVVDYPDTDTDTIIIHSDIEFVSIDGVAVTKGCVKAAVCCLKFTVDVDTVNPVFNIDGVDQAVTHTFATGSAATAEIKIIDALIAFGWVIGTDWLGVTVTEDVGAGTFDIRIEVKDHPVIKLDDANGAFCGCRNSFQDAEGVLIDAFAGGATAGT